MAKRKVKSEPFNPDWTLEPDEAMAVTLTLSLHRHVPGWPGCSDAQLIAVARDVIEHVKNEKLANR